MRLWISVLALGVLLAALSPGVAQASLATDVFRAAFNETAQPEQISLNVVVPHVAAHPVFSLAAVSLPVLASQVFAQAPQFDAAAAAPAIAAPPQVQIVAEAPTVEYYQDATPEVTAQPRSPRFRIGRVDVQAQAFAQQQPQSPFAISNSAIGAGATLNARVGSRTVGVNVSSSLAHYTNTDPANNAGLSNDMVPAYVPPFADISKQSMSAGLAVPVSRRLTANLQIDAQHFVGGVVPFDAYNTVYGLGLTYKMKGPGAISLVTKQYRYQDNLLPLNLVQNSTNLTFSVKF